MGRRLCVEGITAGYGAGKPDVLRSLSLIADAGKITVILGGNGCGKTTLLRAIQGSVPLTAGRIIYEDGEEGTVDLSTLEVRRRASLVTTMPQEHTAVPGLCGLDRVETAFYISRGIFGRPAASDYEKIYSLADSFGITELLGRELTAMSAGERQLISLLRAAVQDTPVILFDEPASALDFNNTGAFFSMLHELAGKGKIILAVLHDPTLALRHGDVLCLMGEGTIQRLIDRGTTDFDELENSLRRLYPRLRLNREPLYCFDEGTYMCPQQQEI